MKKVLADNLDNSFKYIARPDTWYKEGTECQLEANCGPSCGLFRGIIKVNESHGPYWIDNIGKGNEAEDGELCGWDEFDVYDGEGNEIEVI